MTRKSITMILTISGIIISALGLVYSGGNENTNNSININQDGSGTIITNNTGTVKITKEKKLEDTIQKYKKKNN